MPSSVRSKDAIGNRTPIVQAPMSERQQMALLMQMTSINESLPKSPGGTSYPCSRQRDRNERGETPLHLAAIKGDVEQVSRLISNRVDPNTTDFAGWTALHEACNYGWHEVALKLVQAGANVNAKGLDNDTPLHDAAINGHLHIVKLLVEHGADIHSKNSRGKTPLELAPSAIKPHLLNPDLPIPEPAVPSRAQPRNRDEKKITESTKQKQSVVEENMDANKTEDVYEFKSKEQSPDQKNPTTDNDTPADTLNTIVTPSEDNSKRHFSEVSESADDGVNEDDNRKKKRKDESIKEKPTPRNSLQNKAQCSKQASGGQNKNANSNVNKLSTSDKKSPCPSPKVSTSDPEDDSKSDLKVPPLKIVIPQTTSSEQETGVNRNSKSNSQRTHQALPYVVPSSNSSDSNDKDITVPSTPEENNTKTDEKKDSTVANPPDEQRVAGSNQRVLRSSYRAGTSHCPDRSSNNSSPQLQRSHSPSPSTSPAACTNTTEVPVTSTNSSNTISKTTDSQANVETENSAASTSGSNTVTCTTAPVELHPRKRKMKPSKEGTVPPAEPPDVPADPQVHPHDQPITNCYQLFLDIRKQIEKRRKGLFPVQPKPPQGFKDYLMNRCTYVLAGTTSTSPNISYPPSLHTQMKDLFADQEKERYRLRMQHVIEKEKLVLSVEQEILRVHGRAARALANQSLPFSVCSILRDEEVYNLITPEQEEKDRNARSRYNGRLFLSWLQDVDDKWEKIKEHMLLRHHNEAESLHAVQKMDWEWKMKELSLCDRKTTPSIDELHVPMVHVSDDFDLLPA